MNGKCDRLYKPGELAKVLGVTTQTLQDWERAGKLKCIRTKGGHRRFTCPETDMSGNKKQYIYARVSSAKQKADLQRQIAMLQNHFPNYEVLSDVASGINFKRRGLLTLLDQVIRGEVSNIVVAHRDRLARIGFDMFQFIFDRFEVSLTVLSDDDIKEPTTELAKDLLSIITVFTARYHGSRTYKILQKNKILPISKAKRASKQM